MALFVQELCARGIPCELRLETVKHDCRHTSGCDVRTRAHHSHLSLLFLLSAYRDAWVSEAVMAVVCLASHTLYLVVGLAPDACRSKTWSGEVMVHFLAFEVLVCR
jgi:hypothetical protein